jgi:hypothetical protein
MRERKYETGLILATFPHIYVTEYSTVSMIKSMKMEVMILVHHHLVALVMIPDEQIDDDEQIFVVVDV